MDKEKREYVKDKIGLKSFAKLTLTRKGRLAALKYYESLCLECRKMALNDWRGHYEKIHRACKENSMKALENLRKVIK